MEIDCSRDILRVLGGETSEIMSFNFSLITSEEINFPLYGLLPIESSCPKDCLHYLQDAYPKGLGYCSNQSKLVELLLRSKIDFSASTLKHYRPFLPIYQNPQ